MLLSLQLHRKCHDGRLPAIERDLYLSAERRGRSVRRMRSRVLQLSTGSRLHVMRLPRDRVDVISLRLGE